MLPNCYDVLVIGAGPAGATTARAAALGGLRVLLVDKKAELGTPTQCSGAISANALREAGVPIDPEFICAEIHGFITYDRAGEARVVDYRAYRPEPNGYAVDRKRFDRYLARLAERAGAEIRLKSAAVGLGRDDGLMRVDLRRFGRSETVRARVVVGADGVTSQVGKWAGLRTYVRLGDSASCLQYVLDGVATNGLLEVIVGHEWAPGGYVWVFPKGGDLAEVGLGLLPSETERDARWFLERFLHESWMADRFRGGRLLEVTGGCVPLAAPLRRIYADGLILVGDAARQVNPLTGGGLHTALRGGVLAGKYLAATLTGGGSPDERTLAGYQQRWLDELGNQLRRLAEIRRGILAIRDTTERDRRLFETLAAYFAPTSEFRHI